MMPAVDFDDLIHLLDNNVNISQTDKFDNYSISCIDNFNFSFKWQTITVLILELTSLCICLQLQYLQMLGLRGLPVAFT